MKRSARLAFLLLAVACSSSGRSFWRRLSPRPRMEFADAVALASLRHTAESPLVVPSGHSILLEHHRRTPRVFLLLHGFTDAPSQFATVGQHLFDRGDNVYIPRLPHHAVRQSPVRALGQVRAPDLIRFGDSVIALAEGLGDSVIVVGLSAGGTIAAKMAQERASVRRAVLISPALAAGNIAKDASAALAVVGIVLPNVERSGSPDTTRPEYTQGITSRGLAHVLLLGGMVIDQAVNGPAPRSPEITFLLNERDFTVSKDAALILAQRWLDHNRRVVVYRFPISQGLPHNVMAPRKEGGRPELVFPVVESLARGEAPTRGAQRLAVPCRGSGCRVRW